MLEGKYRFVILAISTVCLSMMLANILTLNFTIICMTEEHARWENFTVDLGLDVFEKVDFDPPQVPEASAEAEVPASAWPDLDIPGLKVPTPGFNWQTFKFARGNPELFLRIMKKIVKEVSWRAAQRAGEVLDPRNVDFSKFKNGFNLTDINADIVLNLKKYLLEKVRTGQETLDFVRAEGQNLTELVDLRVTDVQLVNITWDGRINGRIKIVEKAADHEFTNWERTLLFGAIAVGALVFLFPLTHAIERLGTRKTFAVVGTVSAVATGLVPLGASGGVVPFVVLRFLQGIGFAACFPVLGAITSAWAPLSENGLFNGALTGFLQLGPVVSMPLSGFFCHLQAWPVTYYVHALVTMLAVAVWFVVFRDLPREHAHVVVSELNLMQAGKIIVDGRSKHNRVQVSDQTPVKAIYSETAVWAVWVAAIGNMFGVTLIMFAPIFIEGVLKYPVLLIGLQAALPTLMQFFVKLLAGAVSDHLKFGETAKVKLFNSISFLGMAFFYGLVALVASEDTQLVSILFLISSATVLGFNVGGFFKAATLVGRHYSHFVNAHVQLIACGAMLLVPASIYALAPNNTAQEWRVVFLLYAALLVLTNFVFVAFGSGEPGSFAVSPHTVAEVAGEQMKPIIKDGVLKA